MGDRPPPGVAAQPSRRLAEVVAWVAGAGVAWVSGWALTRQQRLLSELRAAQRELAAQAADAERARIARELHDVIAHSLTVTMLHVGGARLALRDRPDDAATALAEVERLCRQSLVDVRRTVGLLARPGDGNGSEPLPGVADVARLVDDHRRAGARVDYTLDGDPAAVPPAVGLGLYRIAEESLSNAARHAPGASVRMRLRIGPDAASLEVGNARSTARSVRLGGGGGLGVVGMRERATLLGGTFEAGWDGDGGWRVRVEVPIG